MRRLALIAEMQRLLIVQIGDYAEAWHRFRAGGDENYRDQRKSVDFVESLASTYDVTIVARSERIHDEQLLPGLRSIGVTSAQFYDRVAVTKMMGILAPDLLILTTPNRFILAWAAGRRIDMIPVFADMFEHVTLRARYHNWRLSRALRRARSPCVANHSLEASKSLRCLGVPDHRIVPFEFVQMAPDTELKLPSAGGHFNILFVGMVLASKGVGDCIEALALLRDCGKRAKLTVIGEGDSGPFEAQVIRLNLQEAVEFRGKVSSKAVREAMRAHDAVVVPSRHDYPEGLPNTIFETLASRTPLIASDHPAFAPRLSPGVDSLRFRAADPADLAAQIQQLMLDRKLYERLSEGSPKALRSLYVGVDHWQLIQMFLRDPRNEKGWVEKHSLATVLRAGRDRPESH